MIQRFIDNIEKVIDAHPSVLSSTLQKQIGPDSRSVYLKGSIIFTDRSVLDISIFAVESRNTIIIDKHRYHYMDKRGHLVFRYDNAPHHRELSTFPHHKHLPDRVVSAPAPSLQEILNEISAVILSK